MRGQHKLFNDLQDDLEVKNPRGGRDPELASQRNEFICYRFYYYARIHGYGYDKCLELTGHDLFLAPLTISHVLDQHYTGYKKILAARPSLDELKNLYSHYRWKTPLCH